MRRRDFLASAALAAAARRSSGAVRQAPLRARRFGPLYYDDAEQKELAQKVFQPGQESNLRIVVNGGEALTLRLQMKLNALEFFAKMKDGKRTP